MCAMSMMMDHYLNLPKTDWEYVNRIEMIAEAKRAKALDIATDNIDCEHEDKYDRIQRIYGVDLRKI